MPPTWAVGLMTGTVLDGNIDIALIRTDGETVQEFGPWTLAPYPPELRPLLRDAMAAARDWNFEGPEPAIFARAEDALTWAQSAAVTAFLTEAGIKPSDVAIIGFHGQTMLHRAPDGQRRGQTRQLGNGALMARLVGTNVAFDFRSADMLAGGQGAPLAASYHVALLRSIAAKPNSAVLNLGGVSNVTWWGGGDTMVAFDTGPANAPLNDWIFRHGLGDMDRDGAIAARGAVDEARLARLLDHPYLTAPYPKSLDRNDFTAAMADGLSLEDGAATLTAFTAGAVGKALDLLPQRPEHLILCGGGRRNPTLVEAIRKRAGVEPVMAEAVGWRGDAVEAECFAFLAVRALRGLPISFPLTTGVKQPITGRRIARFAAA
ncbi:anhydro-N-acetylmuramic acid kinase [Microvirga splendida]|uniref:Anhydro-N-acetylmuramic acid kinase n=1 Tax=Microvirga splendida TaxID=2795727 RepID=A0ABS0Y638_9HYPH|nr:anhydro-N-acetylmuramic acid kinase [Microvirga splendida]MBJ6127370.1 anhydro-N-acetylmuramic acid kinase [Microvirga splendida]